MILVERINEVLNLGHGEFTVIAKGISKAKTRRGGKPAKLTGHEGDQIEERSRYGTIDRFVRKRKVLDRC